LKANINSNINNEQNAKDVQLAEQKCAILEKDVEILQLNQRLSKFEPRLSLRCSTCGTDMC
jgi:hypothetical protein